MSVLRELARGGVSPVVRRTIPIPAPAVATGLTFTPQTSRAWEVLSLGVSLVADSNTANRSALLSLSDGANTLWTLPPTAVQVASATIAYSWIYEYMNVATAAVGGAQAMRLPPTVLVPGWSLTLAITNMQAGDQVSAGYAQVLEALTGETEAEYNLARAIANRAGALAELLAGEVPGL